MVRTRRKGMFALIAVTLFVGQCAFVFAQLNPEPTLEPALPADTVGPTFVSIEAVSVLPDELTIVWTMDETATSYVEYGITSNYETRTPESIASSPEGVAIISGLTADTTYHYRVVAKDSAGNISYSADHIARTAPEPTPADNEPPVMTEVGVTTIATSTATITVLLDELSEVKVEYGTTQNYGSVANSGEEFSISHAVNLTGLTPDTLYHYRVIAEDESGNTATSFNNTFTTGILAVSEPTTTATTTPTSTTIATSTTNETTTTIPTDSPQESVTFAIIDPLAASVSTSTATITWTTTEPATSQVVYGTTSAYGSVSVKDANFTLTHRIVLKGLSPETSYTYGVRSETQDGRSAAKDNLEFTTLPALPVVKPLRISNVRISHIGTSTATIAWTANTPTKGDLHYGTSTAYGSSAGRHTVLLIDHVHEVMGLAPDTDYHYQAVVTDEAGNTAFSKDRAFHTDSFAGSEGISLEESGQNVILLPDPPDTAPPPPETIGGAPPPTPLPKAKLVKTEALEGQVLFVFDKTSRTERIRVVRRNWVSPKHARDGKIVYEGTAQSFTDVNLVNGHTYHYGIYRVDQFRGISKKPVLLAVTPAAGKDQIELRAVPVSKPKTPHFAFIENLGMGATGENVTHLQILLATDAKWYPQGLITGYFGPLTKAALVRFQNTHGLPATGIADQITRKKLEAYSALRYVSEQTASFSRDLSLGTEGEDVLALQKWLAAKGYYPEEIFSGYFGPLTKNAVMKFQTENDVVPASGYFGPLTRQKVGEL